VTARGVTVSYGRVAALRDVDLTLHAGTITGLMGRNGSGKSTLLWTLQGSRTRHAGKVAVGGEDPADLEPDRRRQVVGLVPQSPADLLYLDSVEEECAVADRDAGAAAGNCRALLTAMVPDAVPQRHPRDLSEGQRLALALAIVLTAGPKVLLLDEPTRGLDYPGKAALARILANLRDAGHAVCVATHDVEFVAQVADRVVVLAEGEVVSAGPTRRVVTESPAFAPQVAKVLGPEWLTVEDVRAGLQ
jgi:energy-coupling factor transport system ATP-binding protein